MKNKPYFPMFIALSDKNIVVVGGGNIATRRVKTLLSFTRNIRVIAPKVTMEMMELGKAGYVELITRPVKRTDFAMAYMVIAATNDWKLNDEIYRVCKEEGIYVNVADDKSKCDFYFPGIYMKDEIIVIENQASQLLSEKDAIIEQIKKNNVARSMVSTEHLICTISIMKIPYDKERKIRLFEELDKLAGVME